MSKRKYLQKFKLKYPRQESFGDSNVKDNNMKRNSIYVPKTRESKSMDVIEKIILVCIMSAFTTAVIIGFAMMVIIFTQ